MCVRVSLRGVLLAMGTEEVAQAGLRSSVSHRRIAPSEDHQKLKKEGESITMTHSRDSGPSGKVIRRFCLCKSD